MRSLSVPSVVNFICPSEPVSIVSTSVLPSLILSVSIPLKEVAVITPVTFMPPEFIVTPMPVSYTHLRAHET